jgi:hypothetical protein
LPDQGATGWRVVIDTDHDEGLQPDGTFEPLSVYAVTARSLVLLQRIAGTQ